MSNKGSLVDIEGYMQGEYGRYNLAVHQKSDFEQCKILHKSLHKQKNSGSGPHLKFLQCQNQRLLIRRRALPNPSRYNELLISFPQRNLFHRYQVPHFCIYEPLQPSQFFLDRSAFWSHPGGAQRQGLPGSQKASQICLEDTSTLEGVSEKWLQQVPSIWIRRTH